MDRFRQGTEGFQRRKEFLIGSLIGMCVVLLALLAAVVAPQPRAALAQSDPRVVISVGDSTLIQGQRTYVHASLHNMPKNPENDRAFGNISFRYYFERSSNGSWTDADSCLNKLVGRDLYITAEWSTKWDHGPVNVDLTTTCPVGNYRLRVRVKDNATNTEIVSDTRDIRVDLGPSVTVDMPTGPYYRGTSFNPTIKFNDLVQGTNYTYSAYLMARNPSNYAEICEGTGLERDKTFALNNASGNPVQKTVTITDNCPRNEYTLKVKIKDSDDRERGSKDVDFDIETDPNAEPSIGVTMSESSPVAPGTEFEIIFSFYDIQHGAAIKRLETMTDKTTELPLGRMDCGGGLVGWGQAIQSTFNNNPYHSLITIPSDCPAGEYKIVSQIQDSSGSEIVSGSIDFVIGYPDLTPTAPSISGYTAKQNAPFSRQLPAGSGGDGTLTYEATPLPAGLSFITSTRTIEGTPTGTGSTTVRYTVTDSDGDSDHVDFNITVDPDLTPLAPSITGYTAKQDSPFSQQLPAGSGGDGTLTYEATPLPDGLSFITSTRTIEGTPTGTGTTTVRYTVTDSDGDSDSVDFNITVDADLTPTLPTISGYTIKVGALFTQQLPSGSEGDGTLTYAATGLPPGLNFITTTRTITGTPTGTGLHPVQYTVTDSDGDWATVDFTITVNENLTPTAPSISGYTAKQNSPFTQQLPAGSGGDGNLTYSVMGLPDGLIFIAATRTITGTPTIVQAPVVTYTVRDSDNDESSTTFTITVAADLMPALSAISGYTARVGSPFSEVLPAATGGDTPLEYSATGLPDGLTFTEATRTIAGTPTTVESPAVTYTVRDDDGDEASKSFTIAVAADLMPTLSAISGYTARVGSPFSEVLPAATGGDTPLEYSVTGLPAGLIFTESTRTIAGRPTTVESPDVTYTVRDDDGDEASKSFTIAVAADLMPTLSAISGYTARVGSPFSEVLPAATGGDTPLEYSVTGLPAGLIFTESTRTIAGRPTTVESPDVTYTVRDDDGDEASKSFTIAVAADLMPTLGAISNANAKLTKQFTLQLPAAIGGDGALDYEATGLPPGLSFVESTRTISGIPTTANNYVVNYKATDEDDDIALQTFTIHVFALPSLTEVSDITTTKDELFTLELTAVSGGRAPFDYEVSDLPTGLSFVETSLTITGTPTVIEVIDVTFSVEDADGDTASEDFKITVSEGDTEPTFPSEIQDYTLRVGNPFAVSLPSATGGNAPYTYTLSGHPSTLAFDPVTRKLEGTPDAATVHQVTYTATDRDQDEVSQAFALTVNADKRPTEPSIGDLHLKVGGSVLAELPAGVDGDPPYTYSISALPSGLVFNANTRRLSGRPDAAGVTEVTYTVYDEDSDSATKDFSINVYALPDLTEISDTPGKKGELFTLELPEATGGRPPLTYSVTGMPAGLSFIPTTRVITGTPTQVEVGNVTYKVVDRDNDQDSVSFKITVTDLDQSQDVNNGNNNGNNDGGNIGGVVQTPPALTLGDITGLAVRVGEQYTQQLPAANGGTPPYQYSITTLPAGLSFTQSSHTISGIPTEAGSTNVTYTVTDADNSRASDDFTITVNPAPLTMGDTTGFSATVGQLFTQQLSAASGGSLPYAYGVTTLPAGLTFVHSTRTITGTPTVAVTKVVTYTVSDGNRNTVRDTFTITVNEAQTTQRGGSGGDGAVPPGTLQLELTGTQEFNATVGVQFTQQLPAATGGSSPYAYGVTNLPSGLLFEHATRTIAGTPTTAEIKVVTYSVTDGTRTSASDTFTITVAAAPNNQPGGTGGGGGTQNPLQLSLGQTNEFTATVGTRFTQQLAAASGGSAPYAYGVTALPSGMSFLLATRTITGTPTTAKTKTVTYSVTDGAQASASDTFTITVMSAQVGPPGQPGGGGEQGGKSPGGMPGGNNEGGGSGNQDSKKNPGSSGNQRKYTPSSSFSPSSNQQPWSPDPSPVAITIPDWLNVRRGPGVDYESLSSVPAGTQAGIHGRDPADNWFQVRIDELNDLAWICQDLARVEGSLASVRLLQQWEIDLIPKFSDGPVATTTPAIMNVRAGPGLEYEILTTVHKGTEATIVGIGPNSHWYMVTLAALDRPAWLYASLTTVNGFLGGVKQYTLAELNGYTDTEVGGTDTCGANPVAITTPAVMNVRNGPGLSYDIVTTVVQGTRADIIGIDPLDEWFLVRLAKLDEPAWIYRGLTTVVGSLAGVSRVDSGQGGKPNIITNVERPVAVTYPSHVNVRVGPGLTYPVLKTVR